MGVLLIIGPKLTSKSCYTFLNKCKFLKIIFSHLLNEIDLNRTLSILGSIEKSFSFSDHKDSIKTEKLFEINMGGLLMPLLRCDFLRKYSRKEGTLLKHYWKQRSMNDWWNIHEIIFIKKYTWILEFMKHVLPRLTKPRMPGIVVFLKNESKI